MSAENKNILKYMISGSVIVLITAIVVIVFNILLVGHDDYENNVFLLDKKYQDKLEAEKEAVYAEMLGSIDQGGSNSGDGENEGEQIKDPQKELESGKTDILRKYNALKKKLDKQEAYYEYYTASNHYKTREGRDYHYYGQFYEMFNNVYNADVIFIGSSRSVYGINPRILEQNDELDEYSFYNFSLNAAGPGYYLEWYDVFKNEAQYPTPDTVIYCVDWFMFDSGNWMWRDMTSYDAVNRGALYEIRKYMNTSTNSLANEILVLEEEATTAPPSDEELTTAPPADDTPSNNAPGTPTNFEEFIARWWNTFNQKSPEQRLIDWWNGDERFNLAFVSEGLNNYVHPFAGQQDIPQTLADFVSGEMYINHTRYHEKEAKLKQKNAAELEAYKAQLEEEFADILGSGNENEAPDGEKPNGDEIDVAALLAEYEEEQKAAILKKYYTSKELCIDKDGNISSKFYKGFIPWEYEYHHTGNKTQFHEISEKEVPRVKGLSEEQVEAFKKLIKQMKADGIEVILVQIPDYAPLRPDDQIEEYTALIDDLAKELGVEFYDYNNSKSSVGNSVAKTKTCYSNWNHLNETGANRFTREFAKELVDILKD